MNAIVPSLPPDHLRAPWLWDPTAAVAKDWLHLNVFDHATDTTGIINTSLHGDPRSSTAVAVGSCLFHRLGAGWHGGVEVRPADTVATDLAGIGLSTVALALGADGGLVASLAWPDIHGTLIVHPVERAVIIEDRMPFGAGWISWRAVPRLRAAGTVTLAGEPLPLTGVDCYHDHNWGRWRWGEDAGWAYSAFLAPEPGPAFVLSRPTDRRHRFGRPLLTVRADGQESRFLGPMVDLRERGRWDGRIERYPGSMAALRSDRRAPRLPARIEMRFDDGQVAGTVVLVVHGVAQIVCGEPASTGSSFIHELCGRFEWELRTGGVTDSGSGLGLFEHVD